ncbi:MAG TPA: sensor histidine kinase [Terrimicrobiaceae bacterium]|nr:sensor histidine kinase [Terrimicrobiaceae bacterium]
MRESPPIAPPPLRWLIVLLVTGLVSLSLGACLWAYGRARHVPVAAIPGTPGISVDYLPSGSGPHAFPELAGLADRFVPLEKGVKPHLPPPQEGAWFRFRFANPENDPRDAVLDLNWIFADEAVLYVLRPDGSAKVSRTGEMVRWDKRPRAGAELVFNVSLPPQSETVAFLFVRDYHRLPERFQFWPDARDYAGTEIVNLVKLSAFFGVWVALIAYNLFLYAVLRREDSLYYILYALSTGFLLVCLSNATGAFVAWPSWPLREMVAGLCLFAMMVFLGRFARSFLDSARWTPRADRWLQRSQGIFLALALAVPLAFLPPALGIYYLVTISVLCTIYVTGIVAVAIVRWRQGAPQAPLFVLAFVPVIVGLIWSGLSQRDIFLRDDLRALPLFLGHALELIFFALAIAQRHRIAIDAHRDLQAEYTARLEKEVETRTAELRALTEQLAQTVRDKDRVFAIIGHDLRGPTATLQSLASELARDPAGLTPDDLQGVANDIDRAGNAQLELLNNLLLWGQAQSGALQSHPGPLAVAGAVAAAIRPLELAAKEKDITLLNAVPEDVAAFADANLLSTLLRNLVGNAVKFTPPGGRITLSAAAAGDGRTEIFVADTGVGMEPGRLAEVFSGNVESTPGTRDEKGTGIGLSLCRDLARISQGTLRIESAPGRGTTVIVSLPAARPEV